MPVFCNAGLRPANHIAVLNLFADWKPAVQTNRESFLQSKNLQFQSEITNLKSKIVEEKTRIRY
jgi:hypothetical protein